LKARSAFNFSINRIALLCFFSGRICVDGDFNIINIYTSLNDAFREATDSEGVLLAAIRLFNSWIDSSKYCFSAIYLLISSYDIKGYITFFSASNV
jgi:hypothetical protein